MRSGFSGGTWSCGLGEAPHLFNISMYACINETLLGKAEMSVSGFLYISKKKIVLYICD